MDTTTKSVYIATSPGQSVTAFATSNCAAGIQHESLLGNVGGNCHSLDTQFNLAPVRSLYFWIPIICDIGDIIESLPAEAADFVKDIVEGVALA
jgi:hypothetical protein